MDAAYRLAGIVGVDPGGLSLGELDTMAEAREMVAWDRHAITRADLASALSGKQHHPAEFHPMRRDELPGISSLFGS